MKNSQDNSIELYLKSLSSEPLENSDSKVIARLEEKIQKLEDDRIEERFLWVLILMIAIDFALLPQINNWGAARIFNENHRTYTLIFIIRL